MIHLKMQKLEAEMRPHMKTVTNICDLPAYDNCTGVETKLCGTDSAKQYLNFGDITQQSSKS